VVAFGNPSSGAATRLPAEIVSDVLRTIAPIGGAGAPAQQTQSAESGGGRNAANRDLVAAPYARMAIMSRLPTDGTRHWRSPISGSFELVLLDLMMPGLSGFRGDGRLNGRGAHRDFRPS